MIEIPIKKLNDDAIIPTKAHETDAGFDLYSIEDTKIISGRINNIKTGITINIPSGYVGLIQDKSSLGSKGFKVFGGVIDAGYTGEIIVCLGNMTHDMSEDYYGSDEVYESKYRQTKLEIKSGQKIAQLVILPLPMVTFKEVDNLDSTDRGEKGFGSSGS